MRAPGSRPVASPSSFIAALLALLCAGVLAAGCGDGSGDDDGQGSGGASTTASAADDTTDDDADEDATDPGDTDSTDVPGPTDLAPGALDPDLPAGAQAIFGQEVDVFGARVLATRDVPAAKVTHAASVLAEYVDNDEDGVADDPEVPAQLKDAAYLVMADEPGSLEGDESRFDPSVLGEDSVVQPLYADETRPGVRGAGDATIEEVHHLLLNAAWQPIASPLLDEEPGSAISNAMDHARGGRFDGPPAHGYPAGAWYTYDDETCEYQCMVSEYVYWLHTSLLGGQAMRCPEIAQEWRPCTPDQVRKADAEGVGVLDRTPLGEITTLPNGVYRDA